MYVDWVVFAYFDACCDNMFILGQIERNPGINRLNFLFGLLYVDHWFSSLIDLLAEREETATLLKIGFNLTNFS